jgi:mannosyltransferase OCH1-like enzyme
MPQKYKDAIAGCEQICQQSDIFSYWLVHEYGGIYLDADEVIVRPLD